MDLGLRIVPVILGLLLLALLNGRAVIAVWAFAFLGLPTVRTKIGPASIYLSDVAALVACTVCLRWPATPSSRHMNKWFYGLVAVHALGIFTSLVRYGVFMEPTYEAMRYGIAFLPLLLLPRIAEDEEVMGWFWRGVVAAALCMGGLALIQHYWRDLALELNRLLYGARSEGVRMAYHERQLMGSLQLRVYGMYSTSTCFAGAASMVGALLIYRMGQVGPALITRLALLSSAVAMLLTYSRHGLLAWGVLLLPSFLRRPQRGAVLVLLLAGIVGALGAGEFWAERIGRGGVSEDENLSSRLVDRPLELLERIQEEPSILLSGVGLGTDHFSRRVDGPSRYGFVSNGFALYLFYLGLLAVTVVVALFAVTARAAWEMEPDQRAAAFGALGTAVVVIASDNYGFLHTSFPFMWAVLVALIHTHVDAAAHQGGTEHDAELALAS